MLHGLRALAWPLEPDKVRLFAKPDQLSSRVSTILSYDECARCGLVSYAAQHLHHLTIDQAAKRSCLGRDATREKPANLIHDTARELLFDSSRDAFRGQFGRQSQRQRDDLTVRDT
jgi:hypothetical protein